MEVVPKLCPMCNNSLGRKWFKGNDRRRNNLAIRVRRHKELIHNYMLSHPCVDCGEPDPVWSNSSTIRGTKRSSVMTLVHSGCSWETILIEVDKCDMRCANCHRRKTCKHLNSFKHKKNLAVVNG